MAPPFSLNTPIDDLNKYGLARLGPNLSQKLAQALANQSGKKEKSSATVEDLLSYLPIRYEDRSNPARIRDLTEGMEASLELIVKIAGGFQVKNRRSYGRSSLFIFEVTATDPDKTGRPIVVWWFVSGAHAHDIINYYNKRFTRGARFITFGEWEWDKRRGTYSLHLNKPADELEMLPSPPGPSDSEPVIEGENERESVKTRIGVDEGSSDPALAAIHV